MFSDKSISWIFTTILTLFFCSPWAAIAQSDEQRLIPLAVDTPDDMNSANDIVVEETIPAQDFVVYGRAVEGHPETDQTPYVGEGAYDAGIDRHVSYQHIPYSRVLEPDSKRMPDLETFFEFGGTLELLTLQTEDSTLTKNDLVMSEIMWAIDEGFDEDAGTGTVEITDPVSGSPEVQ